MGTINFQDTQTLPLKQSHLFGRLPAAVDTALSDKTVSRMHLLIEYISGCWQALDLSRNGSFLNGEKLAKNQRIKLNVGDVISLGLQGNHTIKLIDDAPPADLLCLRQSSEHPIEQAMCLGAYNLIPDDIQPELILFRDGKHWMGESLSGSNTAAFELSDLAWVTIGDKQWQLNCVSDDLYTELEMMPAHINAHLTLHLDISADEETIACKIESDMGMADLGVRNHHYLLVLLARQKAADKHKGYAHSETGWVYIDELISQLGLSETLINIQIHRLRKQISQHNAIAEQAKHIIERRKGQIRLGIQSVNLRKNDLLELIA
jgi:hypothetical protein